MYKKSEKLVREISGHVSTIRTNPEVSLCSYYLLKLSETRQLLEHEMETVKDVTPIWEYALTRIPLTLLGNPSSTICKKLFGYIEGFEHGDTEGIELALINLLMTMRVRHNVHYLQIPEFLENVSQETFKFWRILMITDKLDTHALIILNTYHFGVSSNIINIDSLAADTAATLLSKRLALFNI